MAGEHGAPALAVWQEQAVTTTSASSAWGEELGLQIDKHPVIGWSTTTLPAATATRYAATISELEHAITIYRRHEITGSPTRKPGAPACVCACGRRIRVAPSVLALGPILCSLCDTPFAPDAADAPGA